ncbi:MAG: chemotaxis-specific protein-glutamate methyltransferase CheB [Pirellulaceae bacterium]
MLDCARVLIVDDSRIFRGAIQEALCGEHDVAVVGSVFSGSKALEFIRATPPDLVTLDVEMPGLDGLQTLKAIQDFNRTQPAGREVGVLMVSAFTRRGADITVQALQAGAFDFITKPSSSSAAESHAALRDELLAKIRTFIARRRGGSVSASPPTRALPDVVHRTTSPWTARAVLVAASTGGPRALATLLPDLAARITIPILIVQHMPAELTRSLSENLGRQARCTVVEAGDGQTIQPRTVYVAPGGKHLVLRKTAAHQLTTGWSDQPPECGCRPSANVLFRSAAAALGGQVIAVILTGMGNDGTAGVAPLKRAGGYVLVQDEASSVVWGMPGSVVAAGLADAVLPLSGIPAAVQELLDRRAGSSAG